jgi:glucose-6-phosphate isomerase, archaeal
MEIDAQKLQHPIVTDLRTGSLGKDMLVDRSSRTICQMQHVFLDEAARALMHADQVVYSVECWRPVVDGTEGGLFWGNSTVFPGTVGEEYFMTRGHFHSQRNRAEFYVTVKGTGMLVLMDAERRASIQEMSAGTTHYVPGFVAHRVVNTGESPLTLLACWPSDAGHDYLPTDEKGFSVRVMRENGRPKVVAQP